VGRRSAAHRAGPPRWIGWAVAGAIAAAVAVVAVLLWMPNDIRTVTMGGAEYRTNIELREAESGMYAFVPVNTETEDVVLETGDVHSDSVIRDFLERLDTFIPGEHVLMLENSVTIRVIVDGIEGSGGSVLEQLDSSRQ
jgi:hypothetical protein